MSRPYTAAIVGCGSIGHFHIEGYKLCQQVQITAVVDPLDIARRDYQEAYQIPRGYATLEELLESEPPAGRNSRTPRYPRLPQAPGH